MRRVITRPLSFIADNYPRKTDSNQSDQRGTLSPLNPLIIESPIRKTHEFHFHPELKTRMDLVVEWKIIPCVTYPPNTRNENQN